jgi:hypothetical protein
MSVSSSLQRMIAIFKGRLLLLLRLRLRLITTWLERRLLKY